jgi:hypothetical protein
MAINLLPADSTRVQQFWKNILRHPDNNQNPMNDNNGNSFDNAQGGSNVLFFAGNNAQNQTRRIHPIPGRRLFIAVNPVVIVDSEAAPDTDLASIAKADEDPDSASKANLTVNGQAFNLLTGGYRCPTGDFQITVPAAGTLFQVPPGQHNAVADGYYGIIESLPLADDNTIVIDAQVDKPFKQPAPWTSKVTYNFRIVGS